MLFIANRDQKGIQLLDPEDLQGYLAYLAYQVMEKLDLLDHLDPLAHQDHLQYMAQVRGCEFAPCCVCECMGMQPYPPLPLPLHTCAHLLTHSAHLNWVAPLSFYALYRFPCRGGGVVKLDWEHKRDNFSSDRFH